MADSTELIRLGQLLVDRELFDTRTRADNYIKLHGVKVDGKLIKKPGKKYDSSADIELTAEPMPWVSRAALKMIQALDHWKVDPTGLTCLDVGSSTGGFSEVLLDRGAKKIFAVDTGTDQLHERLKGRPELISMEQTDIREAKDKIADSIDLIVVDVSFISLSRIMESLLAFAGENTRIITLFKPQFEVGQAYVGKHGIVKDDERVREVSQSLIKNAELWGFKHHETIHSPIQGGDGNNEHLMLWTIKNQ